MAHCGVKLAVFALCLCVEVLVSSSSPVEKDITRRPYNVVVKEGDTHVFPCNCHQTGQFMCRVVWIRWDKGLQISDDYGIVQKYEPCQNGRCRILSAESSEYYLEIRELQLADAGPYCCLDSAAIVNDRGIAELIVLESDPECVTSIDKSGVVHVGEKLFLSCAVNYSGSYPPVMTWHLPGDKAPSGGDRGTEPDRVWSSVTLDVDETMTGYQLRCVTNFAPIDGGSNGDLATNTPIYTHVYTTPRLIVI